MDSTSIPSLTTEDCDVFKRPTDPPRKSLAQIRRLRREKIRKRILAKHFKRLNKAKDKAEQQKQMTIPPPPPSLMKGIVSSHSQAKLLSLGGKQELRRAITEMEKKCLQNDQRYALLVILKKLSAKEDSGKTLEVKVGGFKLDHLKQLNAQITAFRHLSRNDVLSEDLRSAIHGEENALTFTPTYSPNDEAGKDYQHCIIEDTEQ